MADQSRGIDVWKVAGAAVVLLAIVVGALGLGSKIINDGNRLTDLEVDMGVLQDDLGEVAEDQEAIRTENDDLESARARIIREFHRHLEQVAERAYEQGVEDGRRSVLGRDVVPQLGPIGGFRRTAETLQRRQDHYAWHSGR